jgi:hypothetical protein
MCLALRVHRRVCEQICTTPGPASMRRRRRVLRTGFASNAFPVASQHSERDREKDGIVVER